MLAHNLFRPTRSFCRHSSSTYPFHNINAFRFELSPEEAIIQIAPHISPMLWFKRYIPSIGARLFPGFGFEPLRPTHITPMYFPAWVIDAELRASIKYNDTQRTVPIQIINSYLPGNHLKDLSNLSFWQTEKQSETVPFTSELEKQHDMQVQCLPYSISPFSVLDIAKHWPHGDVEVGNDLLVSPTSIKPTFTAAYPVLIPLYFAQYHVNFPAIKRVVEMTVIMEASSKKGGRVFVYDYIQSFPELALAFLANLLFDLESQPPFFLMNNLFSEFVQIPDLYILQAPNINRVFMRWLEGHLRESETLYPLLARMSQDSPTLQGKDNRVRDFMDDEDRAKIKTCLALGSSISLLKMGVEAEKSALRPPHSGLRNIMNDTSQTLQERIQEFESLRRESFPPWWQEWKRHQR